MSATLYYAPRKPIHRVHVFEIPEKHSCSVVITDDEGNILASLYIDSIGLRNPLLLSLADKSRPVIAVESGNILFQHADKNVGPYDPLISDFGQVSCLHDLRKQQEPI